MQTRLLPIIGVNEERKYGQQAANETQEENKDGISTEPSLAPTKPDNVATTA